jgi:hypothetical protein
MQKSPNKFRINALPGRAWVERGRWYCHIRSRIRRHVEGEAALGYEPQGLLENIGDAAGFVNRRVEGDFERFKEYI